MLKYTIIFAVYFLTLIPYNYGDKGFKVLDLNGMCPANYKSLPIVDTMIDIKNRNGKDYTSVVVDVKEDIKEPIKFTITIQKCDKETKHCSTIYNDKNDKYCDLLVSVANPMNYIFKSMTPQFKCPLKKGTYKLNDKELDLKYLKLIGLSPGIFKIKTLLYETSPKRLINCLSLELAYN